jgi:hypothetical protein
MAYPAQQKEMLLTYRMEWNIVQYVLYQAVNMSDIEVQLCSFYQDLV